MWPCWKKWEGTLRETLSFQLMGMSLTSGLPLSRPVFVPPPIIVSFHIQSDGQELTQASLFLKKLYISKLQISLMEDKVNLCFGARIGSVWWFSEQFPVNSCSANECANLMSCAELFANCLKLSHLLWSAWTNLFQKTCMWYVEITRLEAPIDIVWKTFCCASWNVDFNFQPNFLFLYIFFCHFDRFGFFG